MNNKTTPIISIIMGSQSDWEFVKPASEILEDFGISEFSDFLNFDFFEI